jgi:DNA-binding cell septation regulator SpoVG
MSITINDITIKLKLADSDKYLARATVIVDDLLEIHGWRISESQHFDNRFQENIWIQPPAFRSGFGKWKAVVFFDNKKLYGQIEEKIYDAYHAEKNKPENEKVNPDDIPL